MNTIAYISLGSNIAPREHHLQTAIDRLHCECCRVTAVSPVYLSEAVGVEGEQPYYLNAAIQVYTDMSADQLLEHLLHIEQLGGRERVYYGNPRTIDLDLILFGDSVINDPPRLIVPHPRAHERAFVMRPLLDICAELSWPDGVSLVECCERSSVAEQMCQISLCVSISIPAMFSHCTKSGH
ncbi:MAG: 2-amino-4-hydroxy-6-hydroxymethyldihydropteridine diphosphokinase [Armatimonadota bacterium]